MKYLKKTGRSDGRYAIPEVSDRFRYGATSSYTPAQLKAIFDAANGGDTEALCRCGREILERNWDVIGALEQRADALLGADFDVQPGGDKPMDAEAAKSFEKALRSAGELNGLDTFHDLLGHLTSAVVMPFAASEIIWGEGGSLEGFGNLDAHHFTLRDSFVPRLVCAEYPGGMPEEEAKNRFVFHQFRRKADPARSGKIRVLAWLHCFQNWPIKDLFSFIERFGMPFVIAKVDQNTWDSERQALHSLIRNFGPNGGGVFTKATELQLLNASNTGSDNVYFRALEFTHNAIYTLLVGQLASSGDSSGMSNGDAQTAVRQDILESDARAVEATIRAQIAAPWTAFHFNGAAVPRLHFKVEPTEDLAGFATVINTLSQAGFKADEAELSERFGLKLRYEAPTQPGMTFADAPASVPADSTDAGIQNLKSKYDAMGVAIRAGLLTATPEIEARTRSELGLPEMSPEVQKAWDATGGIRRPTTLKTAESDVENAAPDLEGKPDAQTMSAVMEKKDDEPDLNEALEKWFGPMLKPLSGTADLSDEELDAQMREGFPEIADAVLNSDSSGFERLNAKFMKQEYDHANQVQR